MKPVKIILAALILIGGLIAVLIIQKQAQAKLRADNESLTQQLAQLQTDDENISNQLAQTKNSPALSDEKMNELLKLRGEVGVLQNQIGQLGKVRAENQQLRSQNSAAQSQVVELTPQEQFYLQSWHTANALKQIGLAMRIYAGDNNNQYATNFDQLKNELGGATNFAGNISIDAFEFLNSGLVNDTMPDMIIFREKAPRQSSPNNSWERIYGLADGSVQTIYDRKGDFSDYEKQHSPPPSQ